MKQIAILTSILALTACAGGSGGGHGGTPVAPGSVVNQDLQDAANSNATVTGMYTTIETTSGGTHVSAVGGTNRSATTLANGNKVYDLEDVDFLFGDEDLGEFKFIVDENKKIVELVMPGDEDDPEDEDKVFSRPNTDNKFYGDTDRGASVLTYNSMGKDVGLHYSDFGNINIQSDKTWTPTFIGGYDTAKKITENNIVTDATPFTGKATGSVIALRHGDDSGESITLKNDAVQNNAKLTFVNGTSTLTADFDNWYDVKYIKSGSTETVDFTNPTNLKNNDFYLISDTTHNGLTVDVTESDIRYFGDNNRPSEAVGLIQVRDCGGAECNSNYDTTPEVRMNMSFGVKK